MAYNCEQEITRLKNHIQILNQGMFDKERTIASREFEINRMQDDLNRYEECLEIVAGRRRCIDSLMGNMRMAELVLDGHWKPDTSQAPTVPEKGAK